MTSTLNSAEQVVRFFGRVLTHTKGKRYGGKPFIPASWQEKILRDIFGTKRSDGRRQYRTAYVEIPKKNGKSELGAGIALTLLALDNEPGAEIYSAASTRQQAAKVFDVAAKMVRNNPTLRRLFKIVDSTKVIYRRDDITCFYRAVSAEAGLEDGANPSGVIFDELHRQRHRDLWEVLSQGMTARDEPLMVALTTAGTRQDSPLCWDIHCYAQDILRGVQKDPSFYPVIYALDEDEDWSDEENWKRVNPALGDPELDPFAFKDIGQVRELHVKARAMPLAENEFRRYQLNQWLAQESRWIPLEAWDKCGEPFNRQELEGKSCFAGLDLSATQDITALVLVFPGDPVHALPFFWMPSDGIEQRSRKESVTYDRWAAGDYIELTPGNVVDYRRIRQKINELGKLYDIREIAFDPWNATQLAVELGSDGAQMVQMRQGFQYLSEASKHLEALITSEKLRHGGHPVLRWMCDCTAVKEHDGHIRPVKPERKVSNKRIDGMVALIMAINRTLVHKPFKSIYSSPETAVM